MALEDDLRFELADLASRDRLRETRTFLGPDRTHPQDVAGHPLLSFCSNDYLGLCNHPVVMAAMSSETALAGVGSGASRLVSGGTPAHIALEAALAAFLHTPAALLFPTGYQTNIGVLTALAGPTDLIASDARNHASLIDGCRLSRARIVVYKHADPQGAADALATPGIFRRRILVTESLFSMDGDRAPLLDLASAATQRSAVLIVDEAHALGVVGPTGSGLCAQLGVTPDVLVGTLGKAFGALGGFAAGSTLLRGILVNSSRSFIYSTACPAGVAAAANAALQIASGPEGHARRHRALALAHRLRTALGDLGIRAPGEDLIIPILIGPDRDALAAAAALLAEGILVPAIRPPTVPEGTARLRVTVSAGHTPEDIDRLAGALASWSRRSQAPKGNQ